MYVMAEAKRAKLIDGIQEKARLLETAIASVVAGYNHAAFIWGSPGLGKSHLIKKMMNSLAEQSWQHHTSFATPKGLMIALAKFPQEIHVFEDCEVMLKTEKSAGLLRAACGAPNGGERWVTYETAHENYRLHFQGGVIIASNANLSRQSGPMQGVASRFRPIKWELTQDEVVATILTIAQAGWTRNGIAVTPKECKEVALYLVDLVSDGQIETGLDIRLYVEHALPTYLYCRAEAKGEWKDVMRSKMLGTASTYAEGQAQRTRRLEDLALSIHREGGTIKDRSRRWKDSTQLGIAIYYRHLKAAKGRR